MTRNVEPTQLKIKVAYSLYALHTILTGIPVFQKAKLASLPLSGVHLFCHCVSVEYNIFMIFGDLVVEGCSSSTINRSPHF